MCVLQLKGCKILEELRACFCRPVKGFSSTDPAPEQDGHYLEVALLGHGFSAQPSTWIPAKDVSGVIAASLNDAWDKRVESQGGECSDAEVLWNLLDRIGTKIGQHQAAEGQYVLDVVWLADLPSFSKERWKHCLKPLLIASEHFGAALRTVCALPSADQENVRIASEWSEGLQGNLILLGDTDLEPIEEGSAILTEEAGARVFDMLTRWRGCMLLPRKNAAGGLEYVSCRVRLDALAHSGGMPHIEIPLTNQVPQADSAHPGRSTKKNAEIAGAHAVPLAQGVPSHSSFFRVWKIVDGNSIPMHLLSGGSYSLVTVPVRGQPSEGEKLLRSWMTHPSAAILGCLETWQDKDKRSVDELLEECRATRTARLCTRKAHVLQQHVPGMGTRAAACHAVSRRLVVLQRDVECTDRLLVSAFLCEESEQRAINGLKSYVPFLSSLFFASEYRGVGHSSARDAPQQAANRIPFESVTAPIDPEKVATVRKERPMWCSQVPERRKRARLCCEQHIPSSMGQARLLARGDNRAECSVGETAEEAESGSSSRRCTEAEKSPECRIVAFDLRESLTQMAEEDIQRLKTEDRIQSGDVEDITEKELPIDCSKRAGRRTRRSKDAEPFQVSSKLANVQLVEQCKSRRKFFADVHARLEMWVCGENATKSENTKDLNPPVACKQCVSLEAAFPADWHVGPQDKATGYETLDSIFPDEWQRAAIEGMIPPASIEEQWSRMRSMIPDKDTKSCKPNKQRSDGEHGDYRLECQIPECKIPHGSLSMMDARMFCTSATKSRQATRNDKGRVPRSSSAHTRSTLGRKMLKTEDKICAANDFNATHFRNKNGQEHAQMEERERNKAKHKGVGRDPSSCFKAVGQQGATVNSIKDPGNMKHVYTGQIIHTTDGSVGASPHCKPAPRTKPKPSGSSSSDSLLKKLVKKIVKDAVPDVQGQADPLYQKAYEGVLGMVRDIYGGIDITTLGEDIFVKDAQECTQSVIQTLTIAAGRRSAVQSLLATKAIELSSAATAPMLLPTTSTVADSAARQA